MRKLFKHSINLFLIFCLIACVRNKEENVEGSRLTGVWKNINLHLEINGEKDSVVTITPENWEEILEIQPIETVFNEDSTYTSTYYTLDGETLMKSTGVWYIAGDSLHLTERGDPTVYHIMITGDTVTFRGFVDWDQDGEEDDLYVGSQARQ